MTDNSIFETLTEVQIIQAKNTKELKKRLPKFKMEKTANLICSALNNSSHDCFDILYKHFITFKNKNECYPNACQKVFVKAAETNKINALKLFFEDDNFVKTAEGYRTALFLSTQHQRIIKFLIKNYNYEEEDIYSALTQFLSNSQEKTIFFKRINTLISKINFNSKKFYQYVLERNYFTRFKYSSIFFPSRKCLFLDFIRYYDKQHIFILNLNKFSENIKNPTLFNEYKKYYNEIKLKNIASNF